MKPLKSVAEWPTLAAYDIEADKWVDVTLVCHVDNFGNRLAFDTVPHYLDWLYSPAFEGDIVFAHAGGHYDHRFLIYEGHKRCWDFTTANSGGSIVILTMTSSRIPNPTGQGFIPNPRKKTIRFGDSYRLMPDSLQKIGTTVKLPKLDLDPSQLDKASKAEVLDYCFRDCEIVMKGLAMMRDSLTRVGADFAFTLASIAARYNRRDDLRWDEFTVKVDGKWAPHPNIVRWDNDCYLAYHGGRCCMWQRSRWVQNGIRCLELFGSVERPIYWYDIVSSYPASMREPLPLYYMGFYTMKKGQSIDSFLAHSGVTACDVHIPPGGFITCLPVHNDETGRLNFPDGDLSGQWTNIELVEALKHGAVITNVKGQWRFEAHCFLRKFVDKFYSLRQRAKDAKDDFGSYAYKILLNSAYGKLVETVERRTYLTLGEVDRAQQRGAKCQATATNGVYMALSNEPGPYRHTAAGAYITAYSRLRLFRMALEMHKLGAILYYADTDSLMVDMPIPEHHLGKGLGQWEHVGTITELELVLPKVYRAKGLFPSNAGLIEKTIYKCKGTPIERKWEDSSEMNPKRWAAFCNMAYDPNEADSIILGKDGVTGFVSDVNFGSLKPRRRQGPCPACRKTGLKVPAQAGVASEACDTCAGSGYADKPLVRCLRSGDKKRAWLGSTSRPLTYPLPARVRGKKGGPPCDSASI